MLFSSAAQVGDTVDEPRQSARAPGQGFDGGGLEQGELAAGKTQAVGEVGVDTALGRDR